MLGQWLWSIELHRKLLSDSIRNESFYLALKQIIKKDKTTVVDLGSGTGFLGFLASKLGAKSVIMYEYDKEICNLSKKIAKENNIQNCTFICKHSEEIKNPPKVDVVISETLGCYALEEFIIENMESAKKFLKKGGILIPYQLEQFIAPIHEKKYFFEFHDGWDSIKNNYQLNFDNVKKISLQHMFQKKISTNEIWKGEKSILKWDSLNFYQYNTSIRDSKNLYWEIDENISIYGFCMWWKVYLTNNIFLSTSPFLKPTHWEQVYLPLIKPVHCKKGDKLFIDIFSKTGYKIGVNVTWKITLKRNSQIIEQFDNSNIK